MKNAIVSITVLALTTIICTPAFSQKKPGAQKVRIANFQKEVPQSLWTKVNDVKGLEVKNGLLAFEQGYNIYKAPNGQLVLANDKNDPIVNEAKPVPTNGAEVTILMPGALITLFCNCPNGENAPTADKPDGCVISQTTDTSGTIRYECTGMTCCVKKVEGVIEEDGLIKF